MIQTIITHHCSRCNSTNIVRNGFNRCDNQQYRCNDCGAHRVLNPQTNQHSEQRRSEIKRACLERASLRGIERIFHVSRFTIYRWLGTDIPALPNLRETLVEAEADDVLELDEAWTFVRVKTERHWLWTALCRRTRQIVAFVIGDHSNATCRKLWSRIPYEYRRCQSFSDFWQAYQLLPDTHQMVGKETGQTAHMERWYCTLRQRLARLVRKTLSFSKSLRWHHLFIKWFIALYNLDIRSSLTT